MDGAGMERETGSEDRVKNGRAWRGAGADDAEEWCARQRAHQPGQDLLKQPALLPALSSPAVSILSSPALTLVRWAPPPAPCAVH